MKVRSSEHGDYREHLAVPRPSLVSRSAAGLIPAAQYPLVWQFVTLLSILSSLSYAQQGQNAVFPAGSSTPTPSPSFLGHSAAIWTHFF